MYRALSQYTKQEYFTGRPFIFRFCWYFTNLFLFKNPFLPFSGLKVFLLRLFGAKIGRQVVIKPGVQIKFPWTLQIGDHSWIGENVWIDNLAPVIIGSDVCLSQAAFILTGNHDYSSVRFDLVTKPVFIDRGSWVGARAIVCPGTHMQEHAFLTAGSTGQHILQAFSVYKGNPAKYVRKINIRKPAE